MVLLRDFPYSHVCQGLNSLYWGWFNRNPFNGYINPYYWVDDHPLLYGNNGSLDPGTCIVLVGNIMTPVECIWMYLDTVLPRHTL